MNKLDLGHILRFSIVGFINSILDYSIFQIEVLIFGLSMNYSGQFLASLLSGTVALINSYFFNKRWTFRDTRKDHFRIFVKFAMVSLFSIFLNSSSVYILGHVFPLKINILYFKVSSTYFTKVIGILVGMIVNFILYKKVVFKTAEK